MIRESYDNTFKKRLEKYYDELKWLYIELYHDSAAFDEFCDMMYDYYSQRKPLLKEWDEARLAVPNWYKGNELLGMQMYVNSFDSDLKSVAKHMDYLRECKVNYLHLMPILDTVDGRSDGGYAVANFRKIKDEFGTMDDLAELADLCHENGMSICLDFVMNHTSSDHEWAMRAKAGDQAYQDRYFFFDNWRIPSEFEKTVPDVFPTTAPGNFTWVEEVGKIVMTMFYTYQWDLNYGNYRVFNDMTANMLNLCNYGVDIIRLDAVPYIWKRIGTDNRNQPEVHNLVRMMRIAAEIVCPGTLLLGEVVMEPSKVVPYFGSVQKPECHMLYNVTTMATTWHTVATQDVRLLKHQMGTVFALPKQYSFLNYLRCHDDIGWGLDYDFLAQFGIEQVAHKKFVNDYFTGCQWGSNARGELYNDDPRLGDARLCGTTASLCGVEAADYERNEWKLDMALRLDTMLHAFLLTQSGIPIIYSGDEIGQLNDYTYHDDPLKADDSRYIHRGHLNWDHVAMRHDTNTRQGKLYEAIMKLVDIRSSHEVFESDADCWIVEAYNDHILGIGRYYGNEKLIALFNFSDDEQIAWIDEEEDYINLLTGQPMEAKGVHIPAHDFLWLLHSFGTSNFHMEPPKLEKPKKTAAKKTTTKKPAAKKPATKTASAARKTTTAKKPAAKKTTTKKTKA